MPENFLDMKKFDMLYSLLMDEDINWFICVAIFYFYADIDQCRK
jgi:hypothetical protein